MAWIVEPTAEEIASYQAWVAERPPAVKAVAERFKPWALYRLTTTGHRVTVRSFGEGDDGAVTLIVRVSGDFNVVTFERDVFGISPDDLVECDLPTADEPLGTILAPDEVGPMIEAWRMRAGIAVKKGS